ncbi:class II aldolase/adducin family protein [Salinibacterium hongtaonis]|uniref:Class II aldolase/adducin family protein n=1 Tax=Homoserinimonas hongtaonis TaxID=2079791 RepID=A0A2U1T2E2_9MICO|nr:class II aldolase/adducin family protein [Salinibacterium hongtaonis]AWB88295.1 ribulose phosphate epimerase [Salinibacterium hongtaonis]PWB98049.1 class II aldolase/adducin family protein [Salinibacterium hongtaonis]
MTTTDSARDLLYEAETAQLVSDASRALAFGGLSDLVWGHVSVRDRDGRGVWMKSSGLGFEEITPDHVVLVDWDGNVVVGDGPRHIEFYIHTSIYRARPDVNSVVHAHSDAVNAWCALEVPMRPLTHAGMLFAEPQLPRFTETMNLIRNAEMGVRLAEVLAENAGVLMPQHGFAMTGPDVATAVMTAVLLERAATTMLSALSAGEVKTWASDADLAEFEWVPAQLRAGYEYLVRGASTR